MKKHLIIIGPPAAGKGTVAKKIRKHHKDIVHISIGSIFRDEIKKDTPLGKTVSYYVENGLLVPDNIVKEVLMNRLSEADCQKGFLLDGFPRTKEQAEMLKELMDKNGIRLDAVIFLDIPDEISRKRLDGRRKCELCQKSYNLFDYKPKNGVTCDNDNGKLIRRMDDLPENIEKRMKEYHEQTVPAISYCKQSYPMVTFTYEDLDETAKKILTYIEEPEKRNALALREHHLTRTRQNHFDKDPSKSEIAPESVPRKSQREAVPRL